MSNQQKQLVIITGASGGFGRAIAESCVESVFSDVTIVLSGRNLESLQATQSIINSRGLKNVKCKIVQCDLANINKLCSSAEDIFSDICSGYDVVWFFNNAGSLGPLSPVGQVDSLEVINNAFTLNVTSSCYLTNEFVLRIKKTQANAVIINVTSLAAIQPFPSWGVYCAGKAARDMYHSVLAKELGDRSQINVLSYAPGPLDTEMQRQIREGPDVDPETKEVYINMKLENKLLIPKCSSNKLVELLLSKRFVSGSHIDFYDV